MDEVLVIFLRFERREKPYISILTKEALGTIFKSTEYGMFLHWQKSYYQYTYIWHNGKAGNSIEDFIPNTWKKNKDKMNFKQYLSTWKVRYRKSVDFLNFREPKKVNVNEKPCHGTYFNKTLKNGQHNITQ